MIYLKKFDSHASYDTEINGGVVDISLPNVSYCKDVKDIHYTPYNLVRFYVGEINGTTPQTVKIYTDSSTSVDVQVSKGNKWYTYVLPKNKGLYRIKSGLYDGEDTNIINNVVVKANIISDGNSSIFSDSSIVEASFKGSNTSNVTNMGGMFQSCYSLTSLDLTNFNTSNVTNMNLMFQSCYSLTSLDLANFNTSNVTNMHGMFSGCIKFTSLDVSSFNTSNVTSMNGMFLSCNSLKSLDLSKWDTSKVTDMFRMFDGCSGLTSLTLSGWDTSNLTKMDNMFSGCNALHEIKMVGCTPETITKIEGALTAAGIKDNVTIKTT